MSCRVQWVALASPAVVQAHLGLSDETMSMLNKTEQIVAGPAPSPRRNMAGGYEATESSVLDDMIFLACVGIDRVIQWERNWLWYFFLLLSLDPARFVHDSTPLCPEVVVSARDLRLHW